MTYKPFAGILIVYMMNNDFENLSEEDFACWDKAYENVYLQELKLLSKTNKSMFSKFILDYMIKRRDDQVKVEAMKFIEKLR